jgi:hypothetical protein
MLCLRNNIKNAQPPFHSLGRGTQNRIIDKIMNNVAHRKNGQEYPWLNKTWIAEANWKKQPAYVEYCRGFAEQDARLLRSINIPLTEDSLSEASTPPSSSSVVSKNQKVYRVFMKQLLGRTRNCKNSICNFNLERRVAAMRIRMFEQDFDTRMLEIKNLSKEHGVLKQEFAKHCKSHQEKDKQDPKARRKAHRERFAAREDNNIDSDAENSKDSQALLMEKIEAVKTSLKHAKKRLTGHIESLRVEKFLNADNES